MTSPVLLINVLMDLQAILPGSAYQTKDYKPTAPQTKRSALLHLGGLIPSTLLLACQPVPVTSLHAITCTFGQSQS